MTARRMLSPDQAWIAAVETAMSDKARYVESLSREELDAEVRAMGLDPAVERAKGIALAAQYRARGGSEVAQASDPEDEPSPESKRGRVLSMVVARPGARRVPAVMVVAALAAAGVLLAIALRRRAPSEARLPTAPAPSDTAPAPPPSQPATAPSATAAAPDVPVEPFDSDMPRSAYDDVLNPAKIFGAAQKACAMQDWAACRDLCDRVMSLDTRYRDSKSVASLRELALQHVPPLPPPPPPKVRYNESGKPVPKGK